MRQGKYIELDISADDRAKAYEQLTQMCDKLLANTVIENYTIDLET